MMGAMQRLIREHITAEVSDEMSACVDCGKLTCPEALYRDCPHRLQRAAALAARGGRALPR